MKKAALLTIIFAGLLLSACRASSEVETQSAPVSTPTRSASQLVNTPTEDLSQQSAETSSPPGCTVVSPRPTPGATEQSLFPPVTDRDWTQGPDDAEITLMEYSDFQ